MFPRLIPLLTAAGGVAALVVWLTGGLGQEIAWRLPGADMAPLRR